MNFLTWWLRLMTVALIAATCVAVDDRIYMTTLEPAIEKLQAAPIEHARLIEPARMQCKLGYAGWEWRANDIFGVPLEGVICCTWLGDKCAVTTYR